MADLTTRDLVATVEELYPPRLAAPWDQIGLICGRLDQPVSGVTIAVDLTDEVIDFAIDQGANFILVHHPLFLAGVHEVSDSGFKGRLVHRLIENRIALMAAHTNADSARPGVSDALAALLGLVDTTAMEPASETHDAKNAVASGGVAATASVGSGRIGKLAQPVTLQEFAEQVAQATPSTAQGVRVAGDPERVVAQVAVCGGSGDSYLELANSLGADVYVTSDLKHHRTRDHVDAGGCAVIDIPHWASEFPWCESARGLLESEFAESGAQIGVTVYQVPTDPWSFHVPSISTS